MGEFALTSVLALFRSCRQDNMEIYAVPNVYFLHPFLLFSFAGKDDVMKPLFTDANSKVTTAVLL